jgi:hypothetical protein
MAQVLYIPRSLYWQGKRGAVVPFPAGLRHFFSSVTLIKVKKAWSYTSIPGYAFV